MKIRIVNIICILLLLTTASFGQTKLETRRYDVNDKLFVGYPHGIGLYTNSTEHSVISDTIAFRDSLIFKHCSFQRVDNEERTGVWLEVIWRNKTGYVMSQFVSKTRIPVVNEMDCYSFRVFEHANQTHSSSLYRELAYEFNGELLTEQSQSKEYVRLYNNGNSTRSYSGNEWTDCIVDTYNFTMNDIVNMLEYHILVNNKCYEKISEVEPKIILEYQGSSKMIKSVTLEPKYPILIECTKVGERIILKYSCD